MMGGGGTRVRMSHRCLKHQAAIFLGRTEVILARKPGEEALALSQGRL